MLNREWHQQHRMPDNPSEAQRLAWHLEHARHCGCRPIPAGLRAVMMARGLAVPVREDAQD